MDAGLSPEELTPGRVAAAFDDMRAATTATSCRRHVPARPCSGLDLARRQLRMRLIDRGFRISQRTPQPLASPPPPPEPSLPPALLLRSAVRSSRPDLVLDLLQRRLVDVNARDDLGRTALVLAAQRHGARWLGRESDRESDSEASDDDAPLCEDDGVVARLLLRFGADPDIPTARAAPAAGQYHYKVII